MQTQTDANVYNQQVVNTEIKSLIYKYVPNFTGMARAETETNGQTDTAVHPHP